MVQLQSGRDDSIRTFLTDEDERARIVGSRDPLGVQPIWAAFGRSIIANLTTATTSVRGFTTMMLARYLIDALIRREDVGPEDTRNVFLRAEQVCAYARFRGWAKVPHGNVGDDIRGIEKVKARAGDPKGRVAIGLTQRGLILSDQVTYGLLGLYTVCARRSGLIGTGPTALPDDVRTFIDENHIRALARYMEPLLKVVRLDGYLRIDRPEAWFEELVRQFAPVYTKSEVEFYGKMLRDGGNAATEAPGRQAKLAALLVLHATEMSEEGYSRDTVVALAKAARRVDAELAEKLALILRLEAFLAPAQTLFDFMLARERIKLREVAAEVRRQWGPRVPNLVSELRAEVMNQARVALRDAADELMPTLGETEQALASGDFATALSLLVRWNEAVMRRRNAGPWIEVDEGRLKINYPGEEPVLPARDELGRLWRNSYFIPSLQRIALQLERRR